MGFQIVAKHADGQAIAGIQSHFSGGGKKRLPIVLGPVQRRAVLGERFLGRNARVLEVGPVRRLVVVNVHEVFLHARELVFQAGDFTLGGGDEAFAVSHVLFRRAQFVGGGAEPVGHGAAGGDGFAGAGLHLTVHDLVEKQFGSEARRGGRNGSSHDTQLLVKKRFTNGIRLGSGQRVVAA